MARPRKCRNVCRLPLNTGFFPLKAGDDENIIILTVDEYETIRLIDKEGFSQEQCGDYMNIARTTVQQIYTVARQKLATALVDALPLRIEGGDYRLCDGENPSCPHAHCCKCRHCKLKGQKEENCCENCASLG